MKRIITILAALVLCVSLVAVPAFASDTATETPSETVTDTTIETVTEETVTNTPTEPEITPESEEKAFTAELVDALTNGANWAKFGGVLAAVLAALAVIGKYASGIKTLVGGVKSLVEGKASKDETEKLVKAEGEKIVSAVLTAVDDTRAKQAELEQKYDTQTAILTLVTLQLVKSPYARTEIMKILSTADMQGKNVSEIVDIIEKEIKAAEDAEEKPATPALDSILNSVSTAENGEEANGESGVALG